MFCNRDLKAEKAFGANVNDMIKEIFWMIVITTLSFSLLEAERPQDKEWCMNNVPNSSVVIYSINLTGEELSYSSLAQGYHGIVKIKLEFAEPIPSNWTPYVYAEQFRCLGKEGWQDIYTGHYLHLDSTGPDRKIFELNQIFLIPSDTTWCAVAFSGNWRNRENGAYCYPWRTDGGFNYIDRVVEERVYNIETVMMKRELLISEENKWIQIVTALVSAVIGTIIGGCITLLVTERSQKKQWDYERKLKYLENIYIPLFDKFDEVLKKIKRAELGMLEPILAVEIGGDDNNNIAKMWKKYLLITNQKLLNKIEKFEKEYRDFYYKIHGNNDYAKTIREQLMKSGFSQSILENPYVYDIVLKSILTKKNLSKAEIKNVQAYSGSDESQKLPYNVLPKLANKNQRMKEIYEKYKDLEKQAEEIRKELEQIVTSTKH